MEISPIESNLSENPITGGHLLVFYEGDRSVTAYRDAPGGTGGWQTQYFPVMPQEYRRSVDSRFRRSEDFGYRNLEMLTQLPYSLTQLSDDKYEYDDAAFDYFDVVHPKLEAECPFGLNRKLVLSEPTVGDTTPVFQFCPTCQLVHLRSDEVSERIDRAAIGDRQFDRHILNDLRAVLLESLEATLYYAERKIAATAGEIANRASGGGPGRTIFSRVDGILAKMQHKELEARPQAGGGAGVTPAVVDAFKDALASGIAAVAETMKQGAQPTGTATTVPINPTAAAVMPEALKAAFPQAVTTNAAPFTDAEREELEALRLEKSGREAEQAIVQEIAEDLKKKAQEAQDKALEVEGDREEPTPAPETGRMKGWSPSWPDVNVGDMVTVKMRAGARAGAEIIGEVIHLTENGWATVKDDETGEECKGRIPDILTINGNLV